MSRGYHTDSSLTVKLENLHKVMLTLHLWKLLWQNWLGSKHTHHTAIVFGHTYYVLRRERSA